MKKKNMNVKLLKTLAEAAGVSGQEDAIREWLRPRVLINAMSESEPIPSTRKAKRQSTTLKALCFLGACRKGREVGTRRKALDTKDFFRSLSQIREIFWKTSTISGVS